MGFPEAEAESMSLVSDEGCGAGCSMRFVAILRCYGWIFGLDCKSTFGLVNKFDG